MNELQIFNNPEFGQVRMIEIDGKPYAVGIDVARALGYSNPHDAISKHCKGVATCEVLTNGGKQMMNVIPEGDIYCCKGHLKSEKIQNLHKGGEVK